MSVKLSVLVWLQTVCNGLKQQTTISHWLVVFIFQPNQVKCIEEGPSRCFQPSQMLARRRKNRDFKVREVSLSLLKCLNLTFYLQ